MKLQLKTFTCASCEHVFESPALIGGFGRFLVRSELTGNPALVDTFSNQTFDGLANLAQELAANLPVSE